MAPPIDHPQTCAGTWDCSSRICTGGRCAPAATCTNGLKDSLEVDVDCGTACSSLCGFGRACGLPRDCQSGLCSGGKCEQPASCSNGVKETAQGETDVDCGGGVCDARCVVWKGCKVASDCLSGNCVSGICRCV